MAADIVKAMNLDPAMWVVRIRGIRMEKWRTLSSQEGADGGMFELVGLF